MLSWVAMDIAQMWHFYEKGPLSSLSLGQDVSFLWHCYSWVAAVSCCPISQRFKCKRSFWRQQRSLKDGKRRQKSLSSNFAQIILLRQSGSQIMPVNLPW